MAARDLNAAPPNIYQVEEAEFDLDKATDAQKSEDDVAKLDATIAKENEKAAEEWKKIRDKRVETSEGVHLADPLKTSEERKAEDRDKSRSTTAKTEDKKTEAPKH